MNVQLEMIVLTPESATGERDSRPAGRSERRPARPAAGGRAINFKVGKAPASRAQGELILLLSLSESRADFLAAGRCGRRLCSAQSGRDSMSQAGCSASGHL
jgi:hypothetical protein